MPTVKTYKVVQFEPLPKHILRRYHYLAVRERVVFLSTSKWLSQLVAKFYRNSAISFGVDESEVTEFGAELSEDFCRIYGVKTTQDAFKI